MAKESSAPRLFSVKSGIAIALAALVCAGAIFSFYLKWSQLKKQAEQHKASRGMHDIFVLLNTWAADHDSVFPDLPGFANDNFRVLFQSHLTNDEHLFGLPGDGWCLPDKPDGNLGTAPGFSKALEPGEQSFSYIAGLETSAASTLPLLFYQPGPASGMQVWISVSGSAKILRWSGPNLLSPEWGTNPEKVRLPAVRP